MWSRIIGNFWKYLFLVLSVVFGGLFLWCVLYGPERVGKHHAYFLDLFLNHEPFSKLSILFLCSVLIMSAAGQSSASSRSFSYLELIAGFACLLLGIVHLFILDTSFLPNSVFGPPAIFGSMAVACCFWKSKTRVYASRFKIAFALFMTINILYATGGILLYLATVGEHAILGGSYENPYITFYLLFSVASVGIPLSLYNHVEFVSES